MAFVLLSTKAFSYSVPKEIQMLWIKTSTPYYSTCMCETGVDQTKAINLLGKLELPEDPCVKCFGKCLMVRVGIMSSDGTIIPKAWAEIAGVPLQISQKCYNDTSTFLDSCEKAYAFGKCMFALLPPT
ncbi:hypothetical protein FQR65_LT05717 [Abscondita terminalis]|nr:hypothetical protein FQR65_LT05717 [Abscondita terminalis]